MGEFKDTIFILAAILLALAVAVGVWFLRYSVLAAALSSFCG